jgi:hypothetical protein
VELISITFVIFLVATLFAWITKIDIAFLFAPSIFFITMWQFIFGLSGFLNLGMETLVLFVFSATLVLMIKSVQFRISFLKSTYSPSSVAFFLLASISFLKSKDWVLSQWDEFTHWGHVVRIMYEYGALGPSTPTEYTAEEYPPALSLFQYFVIDTSTGWREGLLFWSLHLIAISIVVSVLAKCSYKHFYEIILKIFVALIASFAFFNNFDNVYSDSTLAITFGFLLVVAITAPHLDGRWSLVFAVTAAFLTLVKPIGIYFALSAILINMVATLFAPKFSSTRKNLLRFRPALASLVAVGTVWMAWGYYLESLNYTNYSSGGNILSRFSSSGSEEYIADVTSRFVSALFHVDLNPTSLLSMPASQWTFIWICFFVIWMYLNGRSHLRKNFSIGITMLILTAGYSVVILNSYLTIFVAYEATNLASFQRYIATWYQGIFFATVLLILSELNFGDELKSSLRDVPNSRIPSIKIRIGVMLLAFIALTSLSSIGNYVNLLRAPQYVGSETREPFAPMINAIKKAQFSDGSKIYIITQHKNGFEYYVLRYEMIGAQFGKNAFSIGSPFGEGDVWTDPTMDVEKWSKTLYDYDFVVLYRTTESFNNEFGSLFESGIVEDNSVYKVVKTENYLSLSKVD